MTDEQYAQQIRSLAKSLVDTIDAARKLGLKIEGGFDINNTCQEQIRYWPEMFRITRPL